VRSVEALHEVETEDPVVFFERLKHADRALCLICTVLEQVVHWQHLHPVPTKQDENGGEFVEVLAGHHIAPSVILHERGGIRGGFLAKPLEVLRWDVAASTA